MKIDDKECSGCGLCYGEECPEVFIEGTNGISEFLPAFQKEGKYIGDVPEAKKEGAKRAAMSCPNDAILVE